MMGAASPSRYLGGCDTAQNRICRIAWAAATPLIIRKNFQQSKPNLHLELN